MEHYAAGEPLGSRVEGRPAAFTTGVAGLVAYLVLLAAYLLPGLVGHDPWKQDETYVFGIIQHILESGDWVVPTMAGEPFMEKPPLYYWTAAVLASLFSPVFALHDGARLATGLFMAITCVSLAWTGERWWGRAVGKLAPLVLLACLGMLMHAHMMLTDIPLVTGFAIVIAGLACSRERPAMAGLLLGTGVGVGFLAKGVLAPGAVGLCALLLPLCFRNWRQLNYLKTLGWATLASLPWLLIWPSLLYLRSPALFMDWFWMNNVGRFLGFSVPVLGAANDPGFWLRTLPWFTFPALPLTLVTLWRQRASLLREESFQCLLMLAAVLLATLTAAASARDNYALPLLLPLALLAAPSVRALPSTLDWAWDWSARLLFGAAAAVFWYVWLHLHLHGQAPDWKFLTRHLPEDFGMPIRLLPLTIALAMSVGAVALALRLRPSAGRGLASWLCGLILFWGLLTSLWLPWIDHSKSYRSVYASLQQALPAHYGCMSSYGTGESERAMLAYHLGIITHIHEELEVADCDVFLVNGNVTAPPDRLDRSQWVQVWEGARPGDHMERFWLFLRRHPDAIE